MADVVVATDTVEFLVIDYAVRGYFAYIFPVAMHAVGIEHCCIAWANPDWLMKVLECKRLRMMESVAGFRRPFSDEIVRHMTITASSIRVVAGLLPAFELIPHNMAISTGARIV